MKLVTIVVMNEDLHKVSEEIIKGECLHPFNTHMMGEWAEKLDNYYPAHSLQEYKDLSARIKTIARRINYPLTYDPARLEQMQETLNTLRLQTVKDEINKYETLLAAIANRKKAVDEKFSTLAGLDSQFDTYKDFLDLINVSGYSMLDQFIGKIPIDKFPALAKGLENKPHLIFTLKEAPPWSVIVLFTLKKDRITISKVLTDVSYHPEKMPPELRGTPEQVIEHIKKSSDQTARERERIAKQEQDAAEQIKKNLLELAYFTQLQSVYFESQQFFKKTNRTSILSGWVPEENIDPLVSHVKAVTGGRCYVEILSDANAPMQDRDKIPYRFRNIPLIKPFELLIKAYGIPSHKQIDPTPFFAFSFMFMFGVMFGDVGDGLVFFLLGLCMALNKKLSSTARQGGILAFYCGSISIIFGFLYGSIFGVEKWLPALWLRPMEDINILLKVALFFGIGMITLGILINIINGFRTRNWSKAIFDKTGLLGGLIYWGCIGLIFKSFFLGHTVPKILWFLFLGLPIILLFFRAPFEKLIGATKHSDEGVASYIMEVFIEVIELFMGYLANTFSFIRVAAFALSHAGLFAAIFTLDALVRELPSGVWLSPLILLFGNILILVLEGMVVTIQAIRLEYYEFFSKFFAGEGILFQPLKLQKDI